MKTPLLIDQALLDSVSLEARSSPRQRKNRNFHADDAAPAHRLLNAIEPGSYLMPHRHLDANKDETMIVLRGRLGVVFFDDLGKVEQTVLLAPTGSVCGVDIPHGAYHTVIALAPGTVMLEAKGGPYLPLDEAERAPWAPAEGAPDAAAYLQTLSEHFAPETGRSRKTQQSPKKTMPLDATPLWDWITERHRIHLRKAAGEPPPWTQDETMQRNRFCNVFRELDRVTVWIRENWREPYADNDNLWIAMCLARQVNWPETLAEVGFPAQGYDAQAIKRALEARKARGDKVYTGAYMISAPAGIYAGMAKPEYTAAIVVGELWRRREDFQRLFADGRQPTLQEVHAWLKQFRGWGDFMAYEVVTDLRHTRYLNQAPDINTWAVAGPGAIRGLHRLHDRPYKKALGQAQACAEMRQLLELSRSSLPDFIPPLELREIEHSLCETDKWLRVCAGQGRLRAKYAGAGDDA